jgi:MFS superfamily sulfate permease-like transporter
MMSRAFRSTIARDLPASLVVFLVALPLCMGIAIASGLPPGKGLLTGIVGGLVVGFLAGSPLQVSGPAAGLAVLVFEIVQQEGIAALGIILMLAGALQMIAGGLRLGGWFRAVSPAVVHGMLAGIGILIVLGQVHVLLDGTPLSNGAANLLAIPGAFIGVMPLDGIGTDAALATGVTTIAVMLLWERLRPRRLWLVPSALVGIGAGVGLVMLLDLQVRRVDVPAAIWDSMTLPTRAGLGDLGTLSTWLFALTIAFVASAETLLSAAAVDRMHNGVRTNYDRELAAQGVGNLLCGVLGTLPMTGVIVRSSANVHAGAQTRWSAVLHGAWLLACVALLPGLLRQIPTASLAGVLLVVGWRLVSVRHVRHLMHRYGRMAAAIWAVTVVAVVAIDLLTGVLLGMLLALIEVVPHLRRPVLRIRRHIGADGIALHLAGTATFLHLPRLAKTLETLPGDVPVRVRGRGLRFVDHTCAELLQEWRERRVSGGVPVSLDRQLAARCGAADR